MSKAWAEKHFALHLKIGDASQETYASVNAMGTGPFKIT